MLEQKQIQNFKVFDLYDLSEIKVEDGEIELKICQFCSGLLQEVEYVGMDRPPPPDIEFEALLNPIDWRYVESEDYVSDVRPSKWMNRIFDANYGIGKIQN